MNIIVDEFFEKNGYLPDLKNKLEALGFNVFCLEYIPYIKDDLTIPEEFKSGDTFVYGTINFVKRITNKYPNIVAFYHHELFNTNQYLGLSQEYSDLFLNNEHILIPYGLFSSNPLFYFNLFQSDKLFIRPNSGNKVFTGLVISKDNLSIEINSINQLSSANTQTLILISKPKDIKKEYRTVIVGNEVVSACQYLDNNEISLKEKCPEKAIDCAKQYALLPDKYKIDNIVVCDVAELTTGEFKIIELNALSTSDLYCCEPSALKRACEFYLKEISV